MLQSSQCSNEPTAWALSDLKDKKLFKLRIKFIKTQLNFEIQIT